MSTKTNDTPDQIEMSPELLKWVEDTVIPRADAIARGEVRTLSIEEARERTLELSREYQDRLDHEAQMAQDTQIEKTDPTAS